jgi:hypothetical protein
MAGFPCCSIALKHLLDVIVICMNADAFQPIGCVDHQKCCVDWTRDFAVPPAR